MSQAQFAALDRNQQARALRLLAKAEADDTARREQDALAAERQRQHDAVMMRAEAEAEAMTQRARALGLPIEFRVQVNSWNSDGPIPRMWVAWPTQREDGAEPLWRMLLDRLEAAAVTA